MSATTSPNSQTVFVTAPLRLRRNGDTDYTATLTKNLNALGTSAVYPESHDLSPGAFLETAKHYKIKNKPQILHIQLRPPHCGTLLSPEFSRAFDRTVVTLHEFIKLDPIDQRTALSYLAYADHVIFSTPYEQAAVARQMPAIMEKSSVIPIFDTFEQHARPQSVHQRPNNIIHFSTVRPGKGYKELLSLATLIKSSKTMKDSKIILVGSIRNSSVLAHLIQDVYQLENSQMPHIGHGQHDMKENIDILMAMVHDLKRRGIKPALPIEMHFDVPEHDLPALFEQAAYAYVPIDRGATHHSTSIPTVMANGCVTITSAGEHTPDGLKHGAVLLAKSPLEACAMIQRRISHPEMNAQTLELSKAYVNEISAESAAKKHLAIYDKVLAAEKAKQPIIDATAPPPFADRTSTATFHSRT